MDPISPELLARLPRTFVPALNEQIKNWDVLFPAERRTMSAQMSWLARLPAHEFRDLFEPIKALEARMDLPAWNPRTPRVSINDTSVLVRSPLYPQWRVAVGMVFDRIDAGVKAGKVSPAWNRLIVCTMPAGSPARTTPMWPALEAQTKWGRAGTAVRRRLAGALQRGCRAPAAAGPRTRGAHVVVRVRHAARPRSEPGAGDGAVIRRIRPCAP